MAASVKVGGVGAIDGLLVHSLWSPTAALVQHDPGSWQPRDDGARARAGAALSPFRERRVKMPELLLLRHAKSRWDEPNVGDRDRDLAPRGLDAAARMGRFLGEQGLAPDLVLCSAARRAAHTWELAAAGLGAEVPVAL